MSLIGTLEAAQLLPAMRWIALSLLLTVGLALAAGKQTLTAVDPPVPAPHVRLPDLDGELHGLDEYRGKPVIVNFWATWCPPCRAEMPAMNRAWARIEKEGIAMVAINVGEDEDTVFSFTGDVPIDFPIWLDRDGEAVGAWPVRGLPTTFVLDPKGRIVYRAIGGRDWNDDALLDEVLALRNEK